MKNEIKNIEDKIIKYHNDVNGIYFGDFTEIENNFFMFLISQLNNKLNNTIKLTYEDIKIIFHRNSSYSDLVKQLSNTIKKFNNLQYISTVPEIGKVELIFIPLFEICKISKEENKYELEFECQINQKYIYFFNYLKSNYTELSFNEFVKIKNLNAKSMHRLFSQYLNTGEIHAKKGILFHQLGLNKTKNDNDRNTSFKRTLKFLDEDFDYKVKVKKENIDIYFNVKDKTPIIKYFREVKKHFNKTYIYDKNNKNNVFIIKNFDEKERKYIVDIFEITNNDTLYLLHKDCEFFIKVNKDFKNHKSFYEYIQNNICNINFIKTN
ncbi:replication initiation protein [Campylobacter canadensis]|uniref:replication initiation protein n=1 Tax=Campylobacter canadensis TaxID=449520 RepID=UPI001CCAFFAE|nr:replication initiation protein [Campylobacter canadensis]MBZ8002395.1 replication initiation protein [Campylobacter canadensis]